jgi:hypothetical protein
MDQWYTKRAVQSKITGFEESAKSFRRILTVD